MTLAFPPSAILISSPMVLTSMRRGEAPVAVGSALPSSSVAASLAAVTRFPSSLSNHSLPTMPLTEGVAPLRNVECPTAVTVGKWM